MKTLKYILPLLITGICLHASAQNNSGNNGNNAGGRTNTFPPFGNVGIGTSTPSENLEVIGNIKVTGKILTDQFETIGISVPSLSIPETLEVGQNAIFKGNVGIGVTTPSEKLEISGNLKVTGNIFTHQLEGHSATITEKLEVKNILNVKGPAQFIGLVGIGLDNPSEALHVADNVKVEKTIYTNAMEANAVKVLNNLDTKSLSVDGNANFNGRILLGTEGKVPEAFKLAVNGAVLSSSFKVKQFNNWPDFVFSENYKLLPLLSLEEYIKTNKHLPGIPSAVEVESEGFDLGSMNARLLLKIEEITLHLIELHKQNLLLQQELAEIKSGKK